MFTALESACQDTDSLDNFTLVCRAMKPAVVIPQLMLQWLHNGSMLVGGGSVSDSGAYVVNTLNVSKAKVNDAGVYQCIASIMIPNSPTVTTNTSSTVFITSKLLLTTCVTQNEIILRDFSHFIHSNVSPQYSNCCSICYHPH